jgi:hypothetical protein
MVGGGPVEGTTGWATSGGGCAGGWRCPLILRVGGGEMILVIYAREGVREKCCVTWSHSTPGVTPSGWSPCGDQSAKN